MPKPSRYIPMKAQINENARQVARRMYVELSKSEEITKAKAMIVEASEMASNDEMSAKRDEAIQLLKDSGISAKHAASLLTKWSLEAVSKKGKK